MTGQAGAVNPTRRLYVLLGAVAVVGAVVLGVAVATTPERSPLDPWRAQALKVCEQFDSRVGRPGNSLADDAAELAAFADRLDRLPPPDRPSAAVQRLQPELRELADLRAAAAVATARRNVDDLMAAAPTVAAADRLSARWSTWFARQGMTPCLLVLTAKTPS